MFSLIHENYGGNKHKIIKIEEGTKRGLEVKGKMGMLERDKREQWRGEYGQCTLYAYTEIS
jgi:hypothetical protein